MEIPAFCPFAKQAFITGVQLFAGIFLAAALLSSCAITKPTYIFKDIKKDTTIQGFVDTNVELKIQKDDLLNLTISSLNPAEDALFNSAMGAAAAPGKSDAGGAGYLVSKEGNIYMHKLGSIAVVGMTTKEVKSSLEKDLLPYLKDPIVNVSFANHFITIMGEAGTSQKLNMPAEKLSILDALALSGHVTINGTLKDVMVIRETAGAKQFKHLNLENASIITSPWYYLQPKDVLIVNPNEEKLYTEARRTRNIQLLSTTLSLISITLILLNRFVK
ncbi:polysaccharide biosynthesis/export family protein [Ferruginibacter paludis]|uniref:polysaccharide biosynthesis/export family protein n=1 Tax=Ferruginibacter paludis TaxID=1310417 RepID=UPI0025B2FF17|nr:polysaccharide biosynthesis/export family protein [Ferruginibacter paludis]MDN3655889.1 polysaccharide biosynthesis/export family protein [Ferruginibacter paludis]